jgi:alpha-L-rhamnosidase
MQQRNAKPGPVGVFRLTLQLIVFLAASSAAIPLARAQSSVAVPPAGAQEPVDPTGPIENVGMNVIADDQGVQAPGYHFVDTAAKAHAWQAKWIWPSGDAGKANAACFRKEIELADAPTQVNAWMTADIKYRLYVNGRLVVRGPVDIGMDYAGGNTHRWFYDWRDLTPFFHQGKNVISAEVFRNWPAGRTISRGKPGFLFEAAVVLPGKRTISVKSDATWKSIAAPQFPDANVYDATKEPAGWRMAGFDDSAWGAPEVVSDVWSPLVPSEIPPLMEARYPVLRVEGLPDDKTITKDSTFTVVFNRVLSAYPILKFKGGKGAVAIVKGHEQAIVVLGDGETNFEFPWMTEVVPSYTVELRNVSSPVQVEDAGAVFTSQPVEYRGSFSCSDDGLNQIWKTCRWTVQINLQTHHMDSPNHQEPICDPAITSSSRWSMTMRLRNPG